MTDLYNDFPGTKRPAADAFPAPDADDMVGLPEDYDDDFVTPRPAKRARQEPRFERVDATKVAPVAARRESWAKRRFAEVWARDWRSKVGLMTVGVVLMLMLYGCAASLGKAPETATNAPTPTTGATLPGTVPPPVVTTIADCSGQLPAAWPPVNPQVGYFYCGPTDWQKLADAVRVLTARGDVAMCDLWFTVAPDRSRKVTTQAVLDADAQRNGTPPVSLPTVRINDRVFAGECVTPPTTTMPPPPVQPAPAPPVETTLAG
jgi:hypothetical protein